MFGAGFEIPNVGWVVGLSAVSEGAEPGADGVGGEVLVELGMIGSPEAGEGLVGGVMTLAEGGGACGSATTDYCT